MRKLANLLAGTATVAVVASTAAVATPLVPVSRSATAEMRAARVAYRYSGQDYCYYARAWRGPGWYVCGTRWATGYGWGGTHGWNGWGQSGSAAAPALRSYAQEAPSSYSSSTSTPYYGRFSPPAF